MAASSLTARERSSSPQRLGFMQMDRRNGKSPSVISLESTCDLIDAVPAQAITT